MDELPKSKKAVLYIGQFLATAVMYGIVMYFLDSFFESSNRYTPKSIFIQSIIFGALFTLYTAWSNNRKKKDGDKK